MNRYLSVAGLLLIINIGLAGIVPAKPQAIQPTASQQTLYDKVNRMLVTVKYKAEITFMGQSDDIEGRVIGLSVGHDGMIIFDGTTLGTGSSFADNSFGSPRVDKPKWLKVTAANDKTYDAQFIGVDPYSSIAFCRLPDSAKNAIEAATFEKSDLRLGDELNVFWMLPEDYQPRFQMTQPPITNILEKPEKYYLTGELTTDFVMVPAVTANGHVVGVITAVAQSDGNYTPSDNGNAFGRPVGIMPLEQLLKILDNPPISGEIKRGWLGIAMQALDPEIAQFWNLVVPGGVVVSEVISGSPAEKAGLKTGDFLIALNNKPLTIKQDADLTVFQKLVSEMGMDAKMNLTAIRPGKDKSDTLQIDVTLAEVPLSATDAATYENKFFDLTVRNLVLSDYDLYRIDKDKINGVMVEKLESGGWAAVGGLEPNDIIIKVNDRSVTSVDECKEALVAIEKAQKREVVFMVWRDNRTQFVKVKTHWK